MNFLNYSPSFLWKRGIVPIWLLNSSLSLFFLLLSGNGRTWARRTWSTWRRCSATTWPRTTRSSRSPSSSRSCRPKTWVLTLFIGSKTVFYTRTTRYPPGGLQIRSRGALRCERSTSNKLFSREKNYQKCKCRDGSKGALVCMIPRHGFLWPRREVHANYGPAFDHPCTEMG